MKVFEKPTVVQTVKGPPRRLTIKGINLPGNLWITGSQGGLEPNYQLLPSLGSEVFLNAFNDKLSQWILSGYYQPNPCEEGAAEIPPYLKIYLDGNIVDGTEVTISYSDIVLKGFIVKLTLQSNAQDPHNGDSFRITLIGKIQNGQ